MTYLTESQARDAIHRMLAEMAAADGSDLFIANDYPPSIKSHGAMTPLTPQKLGGEATAPIERSVSTRTAGAMH